MILKFTMSNLTRGTNQRHCLGFHSRSQLNRLLNRGDSNFQEVIFNMSLLLRSEIAPFARQDYFPGVKLILAVPSEVTKDPTIRVVIESCYIIN